MSSLGWIAYLDMLGTKESSRAGEGELRSLLTTFCVQVIDRAPLLGPGCKLHHFSDCAFLEVGTTAADRVGFFSWLASVQKSLYDSGYFFKCAVTTGALTDREEHVNPNISAFSSRWFDNDAIVRVYELHESFKGIGIYFDKSVVADVRQSSFKRDMAGAEKIGHLFSAEGRLDPFVASCYPASSSVAEPATTNAEIRTYSDLRLHPQIVSPVPLHKVSGTASPQAPLEFPEQPGGQQDFAEAAVEPEAYVQILRRFSEANLKSDRYGRYYLAVLCTLISSSDFRGLSIRRQKGNPQGFEKEPMVARRLLGRAGSRRRSLLKTLSTVQGFPFLMFRLIDCYLSSLEEQDRADGARLLVRQLDQYGDIFRQLRLAPDAIISAKSRKEIIAAVSDSSL